MDMGLGFFVVSEFSPQSFNTVPHYLTCLSFIFINPDEQGTLKQGDHARKNTMLQEEAGRTPALGFI